MDNQFVIALTAIGTFIATIFGKEGWRYLTRRKELESDSKCQEKIRELESAIAEEELKTNQIITAVDMMLTMFEAEFGEDSKYQTIIEKVRESITINKNHEK